MREFSGSRSLVLSVIGVLMGVYLVAGAPFSIDKAQNVVITKLSGLSGFVGKEGELRVDAGKKLLALAAAPGQADLAGALGRVAGNLGQGAEAELKNPKTREAGEKLRDAAGALAKESEQVAGGQAARADFLKEKGAALVEDGKKMQGKSARLMQQVGLRMYVTSYWRGLEVFGGLLLLLTVFGLQRREAWAYPTMVTILALAPIGGLYISLAGAVFFKEPAGFIPFGISLVAFWAAVCTGYEQKSDKMLYLGVMTLLGMIGTDAVSFAEHGIRGILDMPHAATAKDPAQAILRYAGPVALYTAITVLAAIYTLAAGRAAGWWLAALASLGIMTVGFPVDWLRHKDSFMFFGLSLSTYQFGALLGLILLVLLCLPAVRARLLDRFAAA